MHQATDNRKASSIVLLYSKHKPHAMRISQPCHKTAKLPPGTQTASGTKYANALQGLRRGRGAAQTQSTPGARQETASTRTRRMLTD